MSAAAAVLPQQTGNAELLNEANLRLDGAAAADQGGLSVAGAGPATSTATGAPT